MTTLAVIIFLVAAYAGTSLYVRRASRYLSSSNAPWDRLYAAAKEVISDETMPQQAAAFAAASVLCAGCGCVTRGILFDAFTGRLGRRGRRGKPEPRMTQAQRALFSRVVINAIYYDSLRAPFSGFLLRRLVMPWIHEASENPKPRPKRVAQFAASSKEAISHRPEGRKILAMAG